MDALISYHDFLVEFMVYFYVNTSFSLSYIYVVSNFFKKKLCVIITDDAVIINRVGLSK